MCLSNTGEKETRSGIPSDWICSCARLAIAKEILIQRMIGKLTYLPKRGINIKLLFPTLRGLCSRAYTGAGSWRRAGAEQKFMGRGFPAPDFRAMALAIM